MTRQLFIHNLTPAITEDDLREMFSEIGSVETVQRPIQAKTKELRKFAFVTMATDEAAAAAIERFNGVELDGQQIAVKPAEPPKKSAPQKKPKGKKPESKLGNEIADRLGEEEKRPRAQIHRIIEESGEDFARQLFEDALAIHEGEGLATLDGARKRTLGGIFFKLAKDRLSAEVRAKIFPNWRELKKREQERKAAGEQVGAKKPGGARGGQKPAKTGPKSAPAKAAPVKPNLSFEEASSQLRELQTAEQAAQKRLADIRAGRAEGGMVDVLKEVADIKGKILNLLKMYPDLKK